MEPGILCDLEDLLLDRFVVYRVFKGIRSSRLPQIGVQGNLRKDILFLATLILVHADHAPKMQISY
jgi:hypothetical protein